MPLYAKIKGPVGYETIGSPTMVDGIATGFSASNYYKLDTPFKPGHCTWEIVIRAKVTSFATKCNFISYGATDTRSVQVGTTTTGAINVYISSNGTSGNLANGTTSTEKLSLDTYYYILTKFTGTTYEVLVSEDKENWTTFLTVNSSTPVWQGTYFTLGYNYPAYPEFLNGYLDFNESYIKIGDTIFWGKDFARVKLRTTPSVQYSIVGTPTIVDGVVSGFNNNPRSDIITTEAFPTSSPFVIQVKFNTGTLVTSRNQWILSTLSNSNRSICWGVAGASQKIRIYLSSNGGTWDIASSKDGTHALSNNTDYKVRLTFDGNKYVVSLLVDGDWVDDITVNSSVALSEQILRFGNNESASAFWPGSIDLNETYIKINNLSWFDGRFNNLTWTPHILEGDYGFTDGKLVWVNPNLYLQNDGTNNWIDTGFTAENNGYTYESDIKFVGTSRQLMGFGGNSKEYWGYTNSTSFELGRAQYITVTSANDRVKSKFTWSYTGTSTYTVLETLDINGSSVNVESLNNSTMNNVINNKKHYFIFKMNGYNGLYCNAKLYRHKIYDNNNNLVQYLVPVKQGLIIGNYTVPSNGLFDIVTQTFFANQGSGTFIFGKDS